MVALPLFNTAVRFRWLVALLAAFALIMPHLVPPNSLFSPSEGVRVVSLAGDAGIAAEQDSAADVLPENVAENVVEFGDTYSADYSHDSHEVDKIHQLFTFHWDVAAASWSAIYVVALATDPVFSFERPPKPFAI